MKIAIISYSLNQGGSERFVYEHAVAFKKMGHDCTVITSRNSRRQYYASLLERAGVHILSCLSFRIVFSRLRWPKLSQLMHRLFSFLDYMKIAPQRYDVILINQIEAYVLLRAFRPLVKNAVVLLMSHKFQYPSDPYEGIDESIRCYVIDEKQKRELKTSNIDFDSVQYPLSIDLQQFGIIDYCGMSHALAYFARLSPERPIEFIFFALHMLKKRITDVVLHVYGRGSLSFEQKRILHLLGIEKNVIFEGHAHSIPDAIKRKNVSAVWLTCDGNTVGYGAIEIMAHRFPIVLWNLDPYVTPDIFFADHDLEGFVDKTMQILTDHIFAQKVVDRHYQYIAANCDVYKNAPKLLNFAIQTRRDIVL